MESTILCINEYQLDIGIIAIAYSKKSIEYHSLIIYNEIYMVYKKNDNYFNQLNEGTQNRIQKNVINILFFFRVIMYANNM